ncbi:MAG TPA: hypothetical protein ENK86_06260 [Campylobacterales bacterium]|nr:hypothetical protein [Campylobacterales bacterium]
MRAWYKFALAGEKKCHRHIIKKGDTIKCSTQGDTVRLSHKNLDRSIDILEKALRIITTGDETGALRCRVENLC